MRLLLSNSANSSAVMLVVSVMLVGLIRSFQTKVRLTTKLITTGTGIGTGTGTSGFKEKTISNKIKIHIECHQASDKGLYNPYCTCNKKQMKRNLVSELLCDPFI